MADKLAGIEATDGAGYGAQMRVAAPLATAMRKAVIGHASTDVLTAAIMLAVHLAAKAGITEEHFIAYARQQFRILGGAIRGDLDAQMARIAAEQKGTAGT